jgi:hypothetical protein
MWSGVLTRDLSVIRWQTSRAPPWCKLSFTRVNNPPP